ncbi:hypothetical protein ACHAXN_000020 [Cyclotella atomus]
MLSNGLMTLSKPRRHCTLITISSLLMEQAMQLDQLPNWRHRTERVTATTLRSRHASLIRMNEQVFMPVVSGTLQSQSTLTLEIL